MTSVAHARGRPAATSHDEIERVAFELFAHHGFEATTLDAIAEHLGVSRRTVTRYYASKNDIPWGQFDLTLVGFRGMLNEAPAGLPLWERVHRAVVVFNDFPADVHPSHHQRMQLILNTPTLQAHSVLRYRQWREVIEGFVAAQTGLAASDPLPRIVGQVSLALTITAYETWLRDGGDLLTQVDQGMRSLRRYLA